MATNGIDAARLEVFNELYRHEPQSYRLGLEAHCIWEGHGLGNLGKVGPWSVGSEIMEKPTRDFTVQFGSWSEVEEAIGVEAPDDRIEPMESALLSLCADMTESIAMNCSRNAVDLRGIEVYAHLEVDPGPLLGAKEPVDWNQTLKSVRVNVDVRGDLLPGDRQVVEDGAMRSPLRHIFGRALEVRTHFQYEH